MRIVEPHDDGAVTARRRDPQRRNKAGDAGTAARPDQVVAARAARRGHRAPRNAAGRGIGGGAMRCSQHDRQQRQGRSHQG
jgi:hypothetical protein